MRSLSTLLNSAATKASFAALLLVCTYASDSNATPYFRDLGRYTTTGENSELIVSTPSSTSIRFVGHAIGGGTYSGSTSGGAFVTEEPTEILFGGNIERFETGGVSAASFDFRIYQYSVLYQTIVTTPGVYDISDSFVLPAGDYMFSLSSIAASGSSGGYGGVSFDVLLTVPEPSTALLLGLGLTGLSRAGRRRNRS